MTRLKGLIFLLTLFLIQSAVADENEEKVITNLRELAARLGWSQDIFIGLVTQDKDVKVFGIADIPFSDLSASLEKSYIQWVLGHRLPLEKILDRHLRNYRRLGFEIVPIEGVGDKAYRALLYSYILENSNTLQLTHSQEAIEILSYRSLLTLRDERLKLDADAWAIFEEVFERMKKDPFIQPMPQVMPQKLDLEEKFQNFPRRVPLPRLFPTQEDFTQETHDWRINPFTPKGKRDQIVSLGRRYRETTGFQMGISLYAYASPVHAQRAFKRYMKKIKAPLSIQYEEKNQSAFLVSEKKLQEDRYIFFQDIFIFDLKISAKDVDRQKGRELLKSFSETLRNKIKKIFPKS